MNSAFIVGVVLFALGIVFTVAFHEAGHMLAARSMGMRVRRYFIGFGPKVFSFRRGNTEYGLKAIPLGGFCDIAGMTNLDDVTEEEAPLAMVKKPWWARIFVMSAGILVNLALAFLIIFAVALSFGLPDNTPQPIVVEKTTCVAPAITAEGAAECTGEGPAAQAGIKPGETIVAVNGVETPTFQDLTDVMLTQAQAASSAQQSGQEQWLVPVVVTNGPAENNAGTRTVNVTPVMQHRDTGQGEEDSAYTTAAIGISINPQKPLVQHSPVSGVGASAGFMGQMINGAYQGVVALPGKIPGVVASITGQARDVEGPMSVVGASRTGGELVEQNEWIIFLLLLANLNIFLALFNLIPLPPLDGGHIAVVVYERLRNLYRKGISRFSGVTVPESNDPVDYTKLLPITYVAALALMAFGALVIVADIVNPIRLF